jgi:hypothetical protein
MVFKDGHSHVNDGSSRSTRPAVSSLPRLQSIRFLFWKIYTSSVNTVQEECLYKRFNTLMHTLHQRVLAGAIVAVATPVVLGGGSCSGKVLAAGASKMPLPLASVTVVCNGTLLYEAWLEVCWSTCATISSTCTPPLHFGWLETVADIVTLTQPEP